MDALHSVRIIAGALKLDTPRDVPNRARWIMLLAALSTTTLNLAIFIAFLRISITLSLLVFYLYPAFVAVASVIWFRERLDSVRWAALALSMLGMVLVVGGPILATGDVGGLDALGIALAFVAAVSQAIYVLAARHGYGSVPSAQAATSFLLFAAVAYLVIAVVTGSLGVLAVPLRESGAWLPLLFAGTIGAGIPTVAYMSGIRSIGASRAAILATLEPVVGSALAVLLLAEVPSPISVTGGALILVAAVLLQVGGGRAAAPHEASAAG